MGLRRIICLLFLFLMASDVRSQQVQESNNPARLLTRFSFQQFSGGVMIIKACFEDVKDSFNFILDTGSGGISLDSTTCVQYKIPTRPTDTLIKGIAGIRKVSFSFDKKLQLPGLTVEHLNFHVNDYDVLSSVYGEKIDGIIGYSFFSRYIVQIDFDSLVINVFSPGAYQYPSRGYVLHPDFTTLPYQPIYFRDARKQKFPFYLDSGAGLCFLLSEKLVADSMILSKKRKPILTQAEGMGGMLRMRLTVVKEMRLGPYRFKKVPVFLYDDVNNILNYPNIGGVVGNDLFRRFNVTYNYGRKEIHLIPNSHFTDEFDYAYTGMGIYYVDGKTVVLDVIAGSPAEKAGIKVNDVVIGVGNYIGQNIQTYKTLLQERKERVKLIIEREGKLIEIKMKTGSIL